MLLLSCTLGNTQATESFINEAITQERNLIEQTMKSHKDLISCIQNNTQEYCDCDTAQQMIQDLDDCARQVIERIPAYQGISLDRLTQAMNHLEHTILPCHEAIYDYYYQYGRFALTKYLPIITLTYFLKSTPAVLTLWGASYLFLAPLDSHFQEGTAEHIKACERAVKKLEKSQEEVEAHIAYYKTTPLPTLAQSIDALNIVEQCLSGEFECSNEEIHITANKIYSLLVMLAAYYRSLDEQHSHVVMRSI